MSLFLAATISGRRVVWPLDQPVQRVGRSSRNAIHLPDATVSKEHAEIVVENGSVRVVDLGSRNGTRVNGAEATQPLPLKRGDRLEIGHVVLEVGGDGPAAPLAMAETTVVGSALKVDLDQALERRTRTAESARDLVHLVAEAGQLLVLPRPLEQTCEELLGFVARAVPASRYVLMLRDPGGEPVQIAARHQGTATRAPMMLSRSILRAVLEDRSSVRTADASADERFRAQQSIVASAVRSAMAVPLFDHEEVLGLIYVDRQDLVAPSFSDDQLELLTLLGNMAAVKIKNARLLEKERVAAQLAQQLATAARIQRGMLPAQPPEVQGYGFEAFLESCYAVGGDLYDFHVAPDGRVLCVVGDVSGKGLGAAILMSSFVAAGRAYYEDATDLAVLASRMSGAVRRNAEPGQFVTGWIGRLDPASGRLEYVNAGHPAPCVVHGGRIDTLAATGLPFGLIDLPYECAEVTLAPGAMLAVFSDGLPEAQRGEEFFDDARVHEALIEAASRPDLAAARRSVVECVDAFSASDVRSDDLTLLLLRRDG